MSNMLCSRRNTARTGYAPFCDCCNPAIEGPEGRRLIRRREKREWEAEARDQAREGRETRPRAAVA